jgi:hypothetical protein
MISRAVFILSIVVVISCQNENEVTNVKENERTKIEPVEKESQLSQDRLQAYELAAKECKVADFLEFMSEETKRRVQEFEDIVAQTNVAMDSLFTAAHGAFGEKVQRKEMSVQFQINGKDPRWLQVLGPKWEAHYKDKPDGPYHFSTTAFLTWNQECLVLQAFVECLKNKSVCKLQEVEGSVLEVKQNTGKWMLDYQANPQAEKFLVVFKEEMPKIIGEVEKSILENTEHIGYEELMLKVAKEYSNRIDKMNSHAH